MPAAKSTFKILAVQCYVRPFCD